MTISNISVIIISNVSEFLMNVTNESTRWTQHDDKSYSYKIIVPIGIVISIGAYLFCKRVTPCHRNTTAAYNNNTQYSASNSPNHNNTKDKNSDHDHSTASGRSDDQLVVVTTTPRNHDYGSDNNHSVNIPVTRFGAHHVILIFRQSDISSGRITESWLPALQSAIERIAEAGGRSVSVSYIESSMYAEEVKRASANLVAVWILFPTSTSTDQAKFPLNQVTLPGGVSERYMELGNLCSNKIDSENVDVVVFNEDLSVDDKRETRSYSGKKTWDSIIQRIPESSKFINVLGSAMNYFSGSSKKKSDHKPSAAAAASSSSFFSSSNVTVRLVVDPSVISQGMIFDSWLDSVASTMKKFASSRKMNITVEIIKENHNSYYASSDNSNFSAVSSGVMIFYVISAKLDREMFAPNRNHLELGYMVSERGDCDSIAINDSTQKVDAQRNSRSYNSASAWNKIMDKVAAKKKQR